MIQNDDEQADLVRYALVTRRRRLYIKGYNPKDAAARFVFMIRCAKKIKEEPHALVKEALTAIIKADVEPWILNEWYTGQLLFVVISDDKQHAYCSYMCGKIQDNVPEEVLSALQRMLPNGIYHQAIEHYRRIRNLPKPPSEPKDE